MDRRAVPLRKAGAQDGVAPGDRPQGLAQRRNVQGAAQAEGAGQVVSRVGGVEALQQPQALLRMRQRRRPFHVTHQAIHHTHPIR
ncbi:hypothetical protein AZA_42770 [Nitrospirillum viridazoti Y2]|nr:hypothetical protein AZA_42770 [Nitrospirillum amazonense Y2]